MNRLRRKWILAAEFILGVWAGWALAQEAPVPLPAPKSLPRYVLRQSPGGSGREGTGGYNALRAGTFRERFSAACRHYFLGYAEEFEAVPLGYDVHLSMRTQVVNGEAARMVLYHYDFVDKGSKLNLRGKDQLAKMAGMLDHNFFPIVIERTPTNPALAEARRLAVLNELAAGPFPVPPMRVVIGQPPATGLQGREAILIYQNLIRQTTTPAIPSPQLIQGTPFPTARVPRAATVTAA